MNIHTAWGVVAMVAASISGAAECVVSPTGDDANSGTEAAPFRTLARAVQDLRPGDTCLLRGGTYREVLRPVTSGEPGAPLVFRNWPGESVCLSGLDPVTDWHRLDGTVWRASMAWSLGKNNQVFIGDLVGVEARWPNATHGDPLDPEGARITAGGSDFIVCEDLPERPDDYWKGAVLWCLAGAKWTSWTTVVSGYQAATKRLQFTLPAQGSIGDNMNPGDGRGGEFYLTAGRGELDAPYEWVIDEAAKSLLICLPEGVDPNQLSVDAKRRPLAIDLQDRRHVVIDGLEVCGATITLNAAEDCIIRGVRARYVSHTHGGDTGYGLNEPTGIAVSGTRNVIRDSEIAYSVGDGVKLGGTRNAVINCWIHHIDSSGSYGSPVSCWGSEHLISHNTIHDAGRDCMQPAGEAHIIQYNDIYNMGRIAHDLGATYVCGRDGGGTEFRFNWCHDNLAAGTRMGIYLDNFSSNYFVHHNVCWNIRGDSIRLNKPALYNVVVHNTMLDYAHNWGRWRTDWMYGCIYANNAVRGDIQTHPQAQAAHNLEAIPETELGDSTWVAWSGGRGKGIRIPGITQTAVGSPVDVGALESGQTPWQAGHNFAEPPAPEYHLSDTPLRNLIAHGSFDWIRWADTLGPWEPTHAGQAAIVRGPGGIVVSYATRRTVISAGVCLQGPADDGIAQDITGLRADQDYDLAAWVLLEDAARVDLVFRIEGGSETTVSLTGGTGWQQVTMRLRTGPNDAGKGGRVSVTKIGPGKACIDDVGMVGVIAGLEPKAPGLAQLP